MNLHNLGFYKCAKDSTYFKDFMAGIDPTGVRSFRYGEENQKNHVKHRAVQSAGGFIGGAAISTALAGAGTFALGKILKNRNPHLSQNLVQGAKDQLGLFNPMKVFRTFKNFPEALKLTTRSLEHNNAITTGGVSSLRREHADVLDTINKNKDYLRRVGETTDKTTARGLAMTGGLAAGVMGGSLNALSAHVQYNAGRDSRKKMSLASGSSSSIYN